MRTRNHQSSLLLAVVAVLILLLPLLAYLQYDWLGKVSEREREQMQTSLGHTLSRFGEDFDREIARIFTEFESRPDVEAPEQTANEYAKVYAHWNSTAPYPQLIRDIFLELPAARGDPRLQRLDKTSGNWQPSDWTTEFGSRRDLADPIDTRIPALVIPIARVSIEPILSESATIPRLIVRLDLDSIRTEFVPMLLRSRFLDTIADYKIEIRDGERDSKIIYSSDPGKAIEGEGDATERILTPGLHELHLIQLGIDAAPLTARLDNIFSFNVAHGIAHTMPGEHITDALGAWKVTAVHRSGSLDAAVGQLRRKNLAISFSILTLLAISVAVVLASTARAQRLARQQMEFVSAVSHELRTPLAVIRSAGENLADGVVRNPSQLRSYGEVIRNEGRRLTDMVEQILSFAGIQSGLQKPAFAQVDLAKVIDRALDALEAPIHENGFTVERQIPDNVPPVTGDALSLTRAVQNLISNAIKYGAPNNWIGISIVTEGRYVKLAVQDRGSGISSSDLAHIFDPFYRGRSAIDAQIQGSGLGLSIVKQAVASHGGRVDVVSSPGNGSTFTISLPIAVTPGDRAE